MDFSKGILDLEVLVSKIYDPEVKKLVKEAIACYNVGAYRSAINTLWISIVYDSHKKALHLAEKYGDTSASRMIDDIRRKISNRNYIKEWEIIEDYIHQKFKLVNDVELEKIDQIRKLRNLCSHPILFQQEGVIYEPTAEEVRSAIRNAIEIFLSRPPIIGKSAIAILDREIKSPYFPNSYAEIKRFVDDKFYDVDQSFARNIGIYLIKEYLSSKDFNLSVKLMLVLKYFIERYPDEVINDKFRNLINSVDEENYVKLPALFITIPKVATLLTEATKYKLKNFLVGYKFDPSSPLNDIYWKVVFYLKFSDVFSFSKQDIQNLILKFCKYSDCNFFMENLSEEEFQKNKQVILESLSILIKNVQNFQEASDILAKLKGILKRLVSIQDIEKIFNTILENKGWYGNNQFFQSPQAESNLRFILESISPNVIRGNVEFFMNYIDKIYDNFMSDYPNYEEMRENMKKNLLRIVGNDSSSRNLS